MFTLTAEQNAVVQWLATRTSPPCSISYSVEEVQNQGIVEEVRTVTFSRGPEYASFNFDESVKFERRLQSAYEKATALHSIPFLHSSRQPLETVNFDPKEKEPDLFGNECEGMCGV